MRILILFICSLLFSCSLFETTKRSFELNTEGDIFKYKGELYTGLVLDESKTGRVITSFRCINGKIEGEYLKYFKNGKFMFKIHYKNGIKNGPFTKSTYSGEIKTGNYKDDLLNGLWVCKSIDGIILAKGKFENGNEKLFTSLSGYPLHGRIGMWYFYSNEGILEETQYYKINSNIAEVKHYYPSGELSGKGTIDKKTYTYITWESFN